MIFVGESPVAYREHLYPIGAYYAQFPNALSNDANVQFPASLSPATLFGGSWSIVHNAGYFFRTEGGTSMEARTNGIQTDAIRRIYGTVRAMAEEYKAAVDFQGCFKGRDDLRGADGHCGHCPDGGFEFDSALVHPTGSEVRPRNIQVRIWKRTA